MKIALAMGSAALSVLLAAQSANSQEAQPWYYPYAPSQDDVPSSPAASVGSMDVSAAPLAAAAAPQAVVIPAAPAPVAPVQAPDQAAETAARPNINPYDRDIAMTVPLFFNRRVLGELDVLLTRDDRFNVNSASFISLIKPLLTPDAGAELEASLAGIDAFFPEEVNTAGIELEYDPEQLAVLVLRIAPERRTVESLFEAGRPEEPAQAPEPFSAYLNTNMVLLRRGSTGDFNRPGVFLNGAVRYKNFVFEADVQGQDNPFQDEYTIDRRYARLVYDQPEAYRRWTFGDLDPETRGRQGFGELGGFGVVRQKRRFEPFRNNVLAGNRELILREASTVRVLRNGVFVREFRLEPGQYDVGNLPLDAGSNDIQLEIVNGSGVRENLNYRAYLDPIDLEPGDYDYGAYLGVTSNLGFGSPDYSNGDLAFTGFYRKAFLNKPALGIGLQASERVQNVTAQAQFLLRNAGRIQADAAFSNSDNGAGYAFAVGYDFLIDAGSNADSLSATIDFTSPDYATLGDGFAQNPISWTVTANYSKQLSEQVFANLGASYRVSRSSFLADSYSVFASANYRVTRAWTFQVGAEFTETGSRNSNFGSSRDGVGLVMALVWQPASGRRFDSRYASATDSASVRYQDTTSNRAGAFGYSLASTYDDGSGSLSGQLDYVASRFDATLSHSAFGRDFSSITEEQVTTLRLGSSIATTGKKFAVGRTIQDSFAIVYGHPSLKGTPVIVGQSFEGGQYQARSGALGPALGNSLTSYVNQSVRYDALDAPLGYNIGQGVVRVRPTYRSGYNIEVGSAAFVSALGRLVGNEDMPVALHSGRVTLVGDPTAEPQLFFTNSVGRFAIQSLEPGKTYRVDIFSSPAARFEIVVPADNDGLLDLGVVNVPIEVPEK